MGQVDDSALNLLYNLADFVSKIAFCLAIRASAKVNEHVKASFQTMRFIVTLGWSATPRVLFLLSDGTGR